MVPVKHLWSGWAVAVANATLVMEWCCPVRRQTTLFVGPVPLVTTQWCAVMSIAASSALCVPKIPIPFTSATPRIIPNANATRTSTMTHIGKYVALAVSVNMAKGRKSLATLIMTPPAKTAPLAHFLTFITALPGVCPVRNVRLVTV